MTPSEERNLRTARAQRLGLEIRAVNPENEVPEVMHPDRPNAPYPYEAEIEHSKAISLKRLADFCDKFDFWEGSLMVRDTAKG